MGTDKGKLFVFDRIEVLFILVLIILVAITSFTIGVKIGKEYSYEAAGFTPQDRATIDIRSQVEEEVSQIDETQIKVDKETLQLENSQKLQERFEQIDRDELTPGVKEAPKAQEAAPDKAEAKNEAEQLVQDLNDNAYKGKWTIQLGSYESLDDAQKFADGFKVRGYNPIINEVTIEGRGVWYRVGLGVHDSVADAKTYVEREKTLFQGQDYTIVKLQ